MNCHAHCVKKMNRLYSPTAISNHIGNTTELVKRTQARVIAHQAEAPYLLKQQTLPRSTFVPKLLFGIIETIFHARVERIDQTATDGDTIDALGGLQVIHVPGHTPGSIALYHAERRVMVFRRRHF